MGAGLDYAVVRTLYSCALITTVLGTYLSLEGCPCPELWLGTGLFGVSGLSADWYKGRRRIDQSGPDGG